MLQLNPRDVREIIDMLEYEIASSPKRFKGERMQIRSKIRRQEAWLLALQDPTPEFIIQKLQERLPTVFSMYPYGFKDKLKKLLDGKLT